MSFWNTVIFILNMILFILVSVKITQFYNVYHDHLRVKNSIEDLVEQNSQLVDLILGELESILLEARRLARDNEDKLAAQPPAEEQYPGPWHGTESGIWARPYGQQSGEKISEPSTGASSKIIYMRQMGMSVQEIAEKLQLSQGEIDLKLNLQKMER